MRTSANVIQGDQAWALLHDEGFSKAWSTLFNTCPWATPLQSRDFVCTWFAHYRPGYAPVLVSASAPDRSLRGLMPLAWRHARHELVAAGAHQAEYQCWLCAPKDHVDVLEVMLAALAQVFPRHSVRFKYLPASLPVLEIADSTMIATRAELRAHRRPLLRIDRTELEASFRKKSNKSRLNRLSRLGDLRFERIFDPGQLDHCFGDIIAYYDFRQGAVHDSLPFMHDPAKRAFHVDLLRQNPSLLHVTLMSLNGKPLAAHIGVLGKGEVHLAILAYSPFLAAHSPGKLHLMMLGRRLLDEQIGRLDLTPGDDPWKERFANEHDTVWELIVHPRAARARLSRIKSRTVATSRGALSRVGVTPEVYRRLLQVTHGMESANLVGRASALLRANVEIRVYRQTSAALSAADEDCSLRRDDLRDLLKYEPTERGHTARAFLSTALTRLERGEHVYTLADEHKLLYWGWLVEGQRHACLDEVSQCFDYPEHSAVLYDVCMRPAERGGGLLRRALLCMSTDAARNSAIEYIYAVVPGSDNPCRYVVEQLGFELQCSLLRSRSLRTVRLSRSDGPVRVCGAHDRTSIA